jgi:hypothetical protein
MAIIDYIKGELVTPEGKKVKQITEGAGEVLPSGPIATGGGNFYAPGFGSNQTLDYEYYADDPPPVQEQPQQAPQGPQIQLPNPNQGNSGDAKQDDKSGAGAIPDFESWAEAVMTGMGPVGLGGPFSAVAGQLAGTVDYGADYNNANMIDKPGWEQALDEAAASLPPGASQQQIITRAATIFGNAHPGWGEGGQGGGSDPNSPANNISSPGEAKATAGTPGMGNVAGDTISQEDMGVITGTSPVNVHTASGPKPSGQGQGNSGGNKGPGKGTGSGSSSQGGNYSDARDDPGGSFGGGGGKKGGEGSGGGGQGGNSGHGGSGEAPGGHGYQKGGYVSEADYGVPTSMRQNYRRSAPAQTAAAQQRPNGEGGYNAGGAVMRQSAKPAAKPIPARTQRYLHSRGPSMPYAEGGFVAAQGFAEGGVVPQQGYAAGGAVDRFNPPAEAVADDGVVDNQPINADEGEYVIQRESADILGPEILNALNDPMKAKAFSELFDAALGLDSGSSSEGVSAAPMLPPKTPAAPAPMGASLANDNGPAAPMAFNKGGYIGKRY